MFDWCFLDQHDKCRRKFNKMYFDPRGNKMVHTTDVVYCQCKKRGCACYVPPAERTKKRRARKKN